MTVNYELYKQTNKGADFVLDSARRLNKLNFREAPWNSIREELSKQDWSDLLKVSKINSTVAHSIFLTKVIPVLESLVPKKKYGPRKRSRWARKRNAIWRKLKKVKNCMLKSNSHKKLLDLLKARGKLEAELKSCTLSRIRRKKVK